SRLRELAGVMLNRGRPCVLSAVHRTRLMILASGHGLARRCRMVGRGVERLAMAARRPGFGSLWSLWHAGREPVALLRGHPVHAGSRAGIRGGEGIVAISRASIDPVAVDRIAVPGAVVRRSAVRSQAILDIGRGNRFNWGADILQAAQ